MEWLLQKQLLEIEKGKRKENAITGYQIKLSLTPWAEHEIGRTELQ
jgi:hypothetical protein